MSNDKNASKSKDLKKENFFDDFNLICDILKVSRVV